MSQPKITCKCCGGKGVQELPDALRSSYRRIAKLASGRENISVALFAEEAKMELTNAHHHFKRLLKLGVVKKVPKLSPARYVLAE